ncbi:dysbindin-A isoform X1, partial [Tachysurus ichikawai]
IKTLSDKSKEAKIKKKQRREDYLPQYSAGLELLNRYEDTWVTLHKRTKECSKSAEVVDGEVVMLSAHWERRRGSLLELQEQLQQIPGLITDLESITARVVVLLCCNLSQARLNARRCRSFCATSFCRLRSLAATRGEQRDHLELRSVWSFVEHSLSASGLPPGFLLLPSMGFFWGSTGFSRVPLGFLWVLWDSSGLSLGFLWGPSGFYGIHLGFLWASSGVPLGSMGFFLGSSGLSLSFHWVLYGSSMVPLGFYGIPPGFLWASTGFL